MRLIRKSGKHRNDCAELMSVPAKPEAVVQSGFPSRQTKAVPLADLHAEGGSWGKAPKWDIEVVMPGFMGKLFTRMHLLRRFVALTEGTESRNSRPGLGSVSLFGLATVASALFTMAVASGVAEAQLSAPLQAGQAPVAGLNIRGTVATVSGSPLAGAVVKLENGGGRERMGASEAVETKSDAAGNFAFTGLHAGIYVIHAEDQAQRSASTAVKISGDEVMTPVVLRIEVPKALAELGPRNASDASHSANQVMEFADQPNFTVAGVTDWTAVGGHGSDAILRTSETLARDAVTLKAANSPASATSADSAVEDQLKVKLASTPGDFETNHQLGELYLRLGRYAESIPFLETAYRSDPSAFGNEYDLAMAQKGFGTPREALAHVRRLLTSHPNGDVHRLAGDLEEQIGDPLAAVREYEQAVRMDASEQNELAWGSELLLHRAVWQAQEIFKRGTKEYPKSARMLAALGSALFAGALYDEAATRLCEASDLNPLDPLPYDFMGKIELAAPTTLPCIEQKLERFAKDNPENSAAQYLYAMAIWKRQAQPADARDLEQVESLLIRAVQMDRRCGEGFLQLGVIRTAQHKPDEAIGFFRKAIEANPQLGEAHYRLGVAYDRMGESAKAKEQFQLHDEIEKAEADAIEQQRREVKQFLVVLQGQNGSGQAN